MALKKVLIAYFPKPPIIEYLKRAFAKNGVEAVAAVKEAPGRVL